MNAIARVTGTTRLYAIIGDPIVQVRSPEAFTERFAHARLDAVMVPLHVPVPHFDEIVPALLAMGNLDGLLVTIPFKARMATFATRLGAAARCIGAVNALRRERNDTWTGEMFDGAGFVRAAEHKGERIRGRHVALFGAGGAGSAIAHALCVGGVESIDVIDIDGSKADSLAHRLRGAFPRTRVDATASLPPGVDMIVNATPLGMRASDPMPADIADLPANTLVGDVVITDSPTRLIRHAMSFGCRVIDGKDMHAGQIDAIMAFFTCTDEPARRAAEHAGASVPCPLLPDS